MQYNDSFTLDPQLKDAAYAYIRDVYGANYHSRAKTTIDDTDKQKTNLLKDLAQDCNSYVGELDSAAEGTWVDAAKTAISRCLNELAGI